MIKRFAVNTKGRDFAVGDIHGHFTKLQAAIDAVGFDPAVDRLFSVGDMVDRGPESDQAIEWLAKPWFHAVRGNHEQMIIDAQRHAGTDMHFINGGAWFYSLPPDERMSIADALADLPLAIEVETADGLIGIVHADCPYLDWSEMVAALEGGDAEAEHVSAICQWSRRRIQAEDATCVTGVRAVVVGHTPLRQSAVLGNVYHIDTAAWMGGYFTLLNLHTLQALPSINPKPSHDWD